MSPPVNGLLVHTPLELQPWSDWQPVAACMHETPTYLEWQRQTGSALPTTAPVRREGEKKGRREQRNEKRREGGRSNNNKKRSGAARTVAVAIARVWARRRRVHAARLADESRMARARPANARATP